MTADEDRRMRPPANLVAASLDDYRAAKIVIDQFGEEAEHQALLHIDRLFDAADHDGVSRWMTVLAAIQELQRIDPVDAGIH